MIHVLFFAQLREQLQTDQVQVSIDTPCTVQDIQDWILTQHPEWKDVIEGRPLMAAVNQNMVSSEAIVNDSDEVAFFPPVTGG